MKNKARQDLIVLGVSALVCFILLLIYYLGKQPSFPIYPGARVLDTEGYYPDEISLEYITEAPVNVVWQFEQQELAKQGWLFDKIILPDQSDLMRDVAGVYHRKQNNQERGLWVVIEKGENSKTYAWLSELPYQKVQERIEYRRSP